VQTKRKTMIATGAARHVTGEVLHGDAGAHNGKR